MKTFIGNILCFLALFLVVISYGCRTSKSTAEKHKESFSKEELQINRLDSVTKVIKTNKITNFDSIGWNNYFKQYDISYNGTTLEDFGKIEKTDKGWKFSGKLNVNLKEDSNSGDFATIKNQSENINENTDIKSDLKNKNKVDESKSKVDKNKENKNFGPSFNSTIIITISVVVILILLWKFGLPKIKNK